MAEPPGKPIERTGPALLAALLCDQVLEEKNGRLTLVRLLTEVQVTGEGENPPEQMASVNIPLRGMVSLNAAGNPGVYSMALKVIAPDGKERVAPQVEVNLKHDFFTFNFIVKGQVYRTTTNSWIPAGSLDQAFRTFVASSSAPTANAGSSQIVRPGTTVNLDGSGSFDDNTETRLLQYAWSFLSVPDGSAVTVLTGANTMTPSFIPDVPGNYVAQLVVTDEDGLSSVPSQVTIGENLPPTASAGPDQLVIENQAVALNGSAIDADGDFITYSWHFTDQPTGSDARFAQPNLVNTTFTPDLPGVYIATLTPSDFLGPGASASATITVATVTKFAEIQLQTAATQLRDLPADAVTSDGNQNALVQLLSSTVAALQNDNLSGARQQLQQAISRTDGCVLQGSAEGNGPGRDWITICAAQEQVYPLLVEALAAITQ